MLPCLALGGNVSSVLHLLGLRRQRGWIVKSATERVSRTVLGCSPEGGDAAAQHPGSLSLCFHSPSALAAVTEDSRLPPPHPLSDSRFSNSLLFQPAPSLQRALPLFIYELPPHSCPQHLAQPPLGVPSGWPFLSQCGPVSIQYLYRIFQNQLPLQNIDCYLARPSSCLVPSGPLYCLYWPIMEPGQKT